MSTILDALLKLQRERSAQSPAQDLRGSVTHGNAPHRARRRGSRGRGFAFMLALLAVGGGGYLLYRSGQVEALLARFSPGDDVASEGDIATDEDFAQVEREMREKEAADAAAQAALQGEAPPAAESAAPEPSSPRPRRATRGVPPANAVAPSPENPGNPEILAERARLDAALANARAAQAQQRAAFEAANPKTAPTPAPTEPALDAAPLAEAEAPPSSAQKPVVAKRKPPTAAAPAEPIVAANPPEARPRPQPEARPAREPEAPVARAAPRAPPERAPSRSSFPDVRVESIRWHPVPERRVVSLLFETQNAPEAREGDIVGGVLVYRIDPGSVELRVGSAQRTVSPGP